MKKKTPFRLAGGRGRPPGSNAPAEASAIPQEGKIAQGVPLAKLIKRNLVDAPEIVMIAEPRSIRAEKIRRLKTTLVNLGDEAPAVIVVTSSAPAEGKSTISINLALAFAAEGDEKTLLVDADLRRPALGRLIEPRPQVGLSHVVAGRAELEHAVLSLNQSRMQFLPAGEPQRDPMELIGAQAMKTLIGALRQRYDHIIIDTPPLVPFTDADAIGALSDGIVMIARAGVTPVSVLQAGIASVTSAPILGVVLNDLAGGSLADWGRYSGRYNDRYYADYYQNRSK